MQALLKPLLELPYTQQALKDPNSHAMLQILLDACPPTWEHGKVADIKAWLANLSSVIDGLICQNPENLKNCLRAKTLLIDALMVHLFLYHCKASALFAIGGYGRGELFPYSDLDLLIVHTNTDGLGAFEAMIWDIGLCPALICRQACEPWVGDLALATSFLEARFLAGEQKFLSKPQDWVKQAYKPQAFFEQKWQEKQTRTDKQGLEPNLKTSKGTLRDLQFFKWLGNFFYDLPAPCTWQDLSCVVADQAQTLSEAETFFWLVRHHLHTISQQNNNTLSFSMQKSVAMRMGFYNKEHAPNHAAETLMQTFYRYALSVSALDCLGEHFFYRYFVDLPKQPIGSLFVSKNRFAEQLGAKASWLNEPTRLLHFFLLMGEMGIHQTEAQTKLALQHASKKLNPHNPKQQQLFLENLQEPNGVYERLNLMAQTGVLTTMIPTFGRIVGMMQYDLFHQHTVDKHTLLLIKILQDFGKKDFGIVSSVYSELDDPSLLVIAALFHDIAKGRRADHSELGARLVANFCRNHQINDKDATLVVWLVRHHLTMSLIAQKKDIDDPSVIESFAQFCGNVRALDFLYVFTVADMNATNNQLWNNWRASLLKQLYLSTHQKLKGNPMPQSHAIAQKKAWVMTHLPKMQKHLEQHFQCLPEVYFLKHNKHDIRWHAEQILGNDLHPIVALAPHPDKSLNAYRLLIYSQNSKHLFAKTVSVLSACHYHVYGAQILTDHSDHALDSYVVVPDRQAATPSTLKHALIQAFANHCPKVPSKRPSRREQQLSHFDTPTHLHFENPQTLHLSTKDTPALLAAIGAVFAAQDICVHSAKIMTLGERAQDVFVISKQQKPLDLTQQKTLIDTLKQVLDAQF